MKNQILLGLIFLMCVSLSFCDKSTSGKEIIHSPFNDPAPCGTIHEEYESRLENHPAISMAWVEYDCGKSKWVGWVRGEKGLDTTIENSGSSLLFNSLMEAADDVTNCYWLEDYGKGTNFETTE